MGRRFEWVELGPDVMLEARRRTGLSMEAVARKLSVSAKTYDRYEKSGRVPRHELASVAEVLGLEIEDAEPTRLNLTQPDEADLESLLRLARANADRLDGLEETVARIEELLLSEQGGQ